MSSLLPHPHHPRLNGATSCFLSVLHSFTPLHLYLDLSLSECPSSNPSHPPRTSRNATSFTKTPIISWLEVSPHLVPPPPPHSILCLLALNTLYIVETISNFRCEIDLFLIHFRITWTQGVSQKEIGTQKFLFFSLTNSLLLASICLPPHFCQTLMVKDKTLDPSTCYICQKHFVLPYFAGSLTMYCTRDL